MVRFFRRPVNGDSVQGAKLVVNLVLQHSAKKIFFFLDTLLILICFIHESRITQVANICFAPPSRSPALKGGDGGAFVMQLTEKKLKIRLPLGSGKCGFSVLEGRGKEPAEEKRQLVVHLYWNL
jgi:hypothetical protein